MSGAAGIGCIVLAAGAGTRFGADKRQALLGPHTLLEQTLHNILPVFSQRILVLRTGDEPLAELFTGQWQVVFAAEAHKGMGHSLAAAISATRGWQGAVIALGDMPFVQTATYRAICTRLTPENLVVPYYHGKRGNPVGIGSRYFRDLAGLRGDRGARALLEGHETEVLRLEVDDAGILRDIDTREALEAAGSGTQPAGD